MKNIACRSLGILALIICCGLSSAAQAPDDLHVVLRKQTGITENDAESVRADSAPDISANLLKVQVDLVLVPVTVTDSLNRPVFGLGKDNFAVYEDDKPQQIRFFSDEDSPISVGILLDVSGTMSNKIDAAREALADFFKASHPDDDYFVITFADRARLLANSTKSAGDIQGRLATVKPYGYTALLDATEMGLAKLRSARYQRRALLIISDGGDNSSRHKLQDVKQLVEESGVEVYAIGLFDDGLPILKSIDEKLGKRILSQLTEASGGHTVTVENLARLAEVATCISTEMRSQYMLGYRPTNPVRNGKWRKIRVKVASPVDGGTDTVSLHPAYKKGYTAPN